MSIAFSRARNQFRQGLRDLGYIEGKNIAIVAKSAEGNPDRFPELARELVRLNVNVMVVAGDQGLRAAKEATDAIPIIVAACDPLDALVVSIAPRRQVHRIDLHLFGIGG
jgi:putative tryptophan/tyrosine transport system substrate-binding protein